MHLFANEFQEILPGWWSSCSRKLQESIVGRFKWICQGFFTKGPVSHIHKNLGSLRSWEARKGNAGRRWGRNRAVCECSCSRSLSTGRSGHPGTQRHVSKCRSYHFLCVAGPTETFWYLTYTGSNLGLTVCIANTVSRCAAWLPILAPCIHFFPYIAFFCLFYINPFSLWDPKDALPCPYLKGLWFYLSHSVAPCLLLHCMTKS